MCNYEKQAIKFCQKNKIKFEIIGTPTYGLHFVGDKDSRWIFKIRLSSGGKSYTFNFGQSIANGAKKPDVYSVLACLQKYDVGTFDEFCDEFGYEKLENKYTVFQMVNSNSYKIYKAVCREFAGVERVFSHCMDELQEIN